MRRSLAFLTALTALALVVGTAGAGASAPAGPGLWPSDHMAAVTDCGAFSRDPDNFCFLDDGGAVELGVKFTTATPVLITGVRVYRVDAGSVTGSLWSAGGTLLATGAFAAQSGHGWQDLIFATPVAISPGNTYIASYFAPNAQYAFEWDFFTSSALTEGPVTALQSVAGDRNGVYCYVGEPCNLFPTNSFRDTNYWVSPLWDNTAPQITIDSPGDGATYLLNQQVSADYACTDDYDQSPSCVGTVADGADIDTASVGSKTFTVASEDSSGNGSSLSHTYSVTYGFEGFYSPVDNAPALNVAKAGSSIPLKFRVIDANGVPVTDLAGVTVKATSLACSLGETTDQIEEYAAGGSGLQNLGDGYYQFNWKTPKTYANSCKTATLTLGGGGSHSALFRFTK